MITRKYSKKTRRLLLITKKNYQKTMRISYALYYRQQRSQSQRHQVKYIKRLNKKKSTAQDFQTAFNKISNGRVNLKQYDK